jgi:hypothetical protein
MYTYRMHLPDGTDAGTATYAVLVRPGEEIVDGSSRDSPGARGSWFRTAITRACTAAGVPAFSPTISATAGSRYCTSARAVGAYR